MKVRAETIYTPLLNPTMISALQLSVLKPLDISIFDFL